ncbi:Sec-independent protein translocase protein TatB [Ancylobacter dichloromethanicus]|uniref:Sec-independent protein translocase protein TatB n=1 Tax=Ancylobacter dichloromethanicus TaxID=518825 RepID=A0A9W6J7N0_9HYPH|nr:Sec-independent protein translocase protein TatB [Ancylobacter dichloromethanicus]MBS7554137.1 Sec-independent protein translocase protein TatB [Ancylobacter dichloromethanicus]GLK71253.1 hypothetical protein GCM10017643_13680 [Ancylobacter dichloromethanicus]
MLDIGWTELLVIGVVALVVIGPNELPRVLRTVGQSVRKLRRMAGEFQGQFNEALREAELSDLKDSVSGLKNDLAGMASDARNTIAKAIPENALPTNPLQDIANDLKAPTGSVEAGTGLPPAEVAQDALPPTGDLEPHPFETVEDEVRAATAGLDTASSPPDAPRPQTAMAPADAKAADIKAADVKPVQSGPAESAPPAPKPKRARGASSVVETAAPKPAARRAARKPAATPEAVEPEVSEAVASLDHAAPAAPAKRATKPRVKVKPTSGSEGPAT